MFFCRAANRALFGPAELKLNRGMKQQHDSDLSEWRRRAQLGAHDIVVAVALTVMAVGLIGVAWLGNHRTGDARIGPSAEVSPR